MERKRGYLRTAENDYLYLVDDYERNHFGNPFCFHSQNICERYLKHVVDVYCSDDDKTDVLKTHSLRKLVRYIQKNLPELQCDWNSVLKADWFCFNTGYPGEDYIEVTEEDCVDCWEAVLVVRSAVNSYCTEKAKIPAKAVVESQTFTDLINSFDDKTMLQ